MLTPPDDLATEDLADALRSGWGIRPGSLDYAPVGFGSHHWTTTDRSGRDWFVTADRTGADATDAGVLSAALTTTLWLSHLGLEFIVPPVTTRSGSVVHRVGDYVLTLYPHLEESSGDQPDVTKLIARLHEATPGVRTYAPVEDFAIPHRDAVTRPGRDDTGPYADRFQRLISVHAPTIRDAFGRYDTGAAGRRRDRSEWVITHGEPKPDNIMITAAGPVLIDWETLRLAPPARDLWIVGDPEEYAEITGRAIDGDDLELFRLRWDLADLTSFAAWFTAPHEQTPQTEVAWQACVDICEHRLEHHLSRS